MGLFWGKPFTVHELLDHPCPVIRPINRNGVIVMRARHRRAWTQGVRAVAVVTAAALVMGQAEPAAADHTATPPPGSVTLTASATEVEAGESFTLTAVTSSAVELSLSNVVIVDLTRNVSVKQCTSGATCVGTTSIFDGKPEHRYEARVWHRTILYAVSETVTVSLAPWTVTLASTKLSFRVGETFTLTATSNQDVSRTGGTLAQVISDETTSTRVGQCTTGTSCSVTLSFASGPPRTYVAYVSKPNNYPPVDVRATSQPVTVSRAPWTITLLYRREIISGLDYVRLTATANQAVGQTSSAYSISIGNLDSPTRLAQCTTGTSCQVLVRVTPGASYRFIAYVSKTNWYPPQDIQATSNVVGIRIPDGQTRGCGNGTATPDPTATRGDEVNTATGAFCETADDLDLPGRGVTLDFSRTYDSAGTATGPLGAGWTGTYDTALSGVGTPTVQLRAEDGQQVTFSRQPDGSYEGDDGAASELETVAGGYRLTSPDQRVYSFDSAGALTGIADRHGDGVTVSRAVGRVDTVTDAAGRTATFAYTSDRLTRITLADGRHVAYTYDPDGRLATANDLRGNVTTYGYDPAGRLTTVTDPLGHVVVRNVYDPVTGRMTEQYDALDNKTTFAWDPATQTATTTDPRGAVTIDVYDGNVLQSTTTPAGTTSYGYDEQLRRVHITDPLGQTSYLSYDPAGNVLSRRDPSPLSYTRSFTYTTDNQILTAVDRNGVTAVRNSYDTQGRLVSSTDALGGVTGWSYGTSNRITSTTDPRGKTTSFEYDPAGNMTALVSPTGRRTTLRYDTAGRLVATVDPRGNEPGADPDAYTTTYAYDDGDNLLNVTDPAGAITRFEYDAAGRRVSATDALGNVTRYAYDDAGNLVSVTEPPNPATSATTTYSYDAAGNLVAVTDPLGHRTTYTYDLAGRRTGVTDPRGNEPGADPAEFTTSYEYDAAGNLVTIREPVPGGTTTLEYDELDRLVRQTEPLGRITAWTYDPNGNVLSMTSPAGGTHTFGYDLLGRRTAETDPLGNVTRLGYDASGDLTSRTTPLGFVTSYGYDDDGRLVSVIDPRGNQPGADPAEFTTRIGYDTAGHLLSETDPLGNARRWSYDLAGNMTAATDPNGHVTAYTYNALRRLTAVRGPDVPADEVTPLTGLTRYTYDPTGNISSRTDPLGRITRYEYDSAHQLTAVTDPTGNRTGHGYDAAGNLVETTTPNGAATPDAGDGTIRATYDTLGQLTRIDYADATPDVTFSYDAAGRRTSMTDGAGTQTYTYDLADQLTATSRDGTGFSYDYDLAGRLLERTYPDGTVVAHDYDPDSRLASVTYAGATTTFGYDSAGRPIRNTLPGTNGWEETRSYDRAGRLTAVRNASPTQVLSEFTRTLDPAGNPLTETTTRGLSTSTDTYTYDVADRLTAVCRGVTSCAGAADVTSYSYDTVGNRTRETSGTALPTIYTYDAADRLVAVAAPSALTRYEYNPNGNLLREHTLGGADRRYDYDLADRQTQVHLPNPDGSTTTTAYTFDGTGNRLTTAVEGVTTERLRWDNVLGQPQLATRADSGGTIVQLVAHADRPLALTTAAGTSYLHYDTLGSVSDLTAADGTPEVRYDYEPFGQTRASPLTADPPANPFQYAGALADPQTGHYHMGARQYDPTAGRFLSPDPAPAGLGQPVDGNYSYAGNRPTAFTETDGMFASPAGGYHDLDNPLEGADAANTYEGAVLPCIGSATDFATCALSMHPAGDLLLAALEAWRLWQLGCWEELIALAMDKLGDFIIDAAIGIAVGAVVTALTGGLGIAAMIAPVLAAVRRAMQAAKAMLSAAYRATARAAYRRLPSGVRRAYRSTARRLRGEGGSRSFYTVQGPDDVARLHGSGKPWPTEPHRSALGEGVYSLESREAAEAYLARRRATLAESGLHPDLSIQRLQVANYQLARMRTLNIGSKPNPTAFIKSHSRLYGGSGVSGYAHVIRGAGDFGVEHFFSKEAFARLRFD